MDNDLIATNEDLGGLALYQADPHAADLLQGPVPIHATWEQEARFLRHALAKALRMVEYLNNEVSRLTRNDEASSFDGSEIAVDASELHDRLV